MLFINISEFVLLSTRVAVPLFFIISGYLFFLHYINTWECYKTKMTARIFHLLQPILVWTTLYLILYYIAQQLPYTSGLFSGSNLDVASYGWRDFIGAYSGIFTNGEMFAGQFWFIRNLFVVCLFSPIIWYLLRYAKYSILVIVGIFWFFQSPLKINLFWIDALFFFMIGACIAINKIDLEKVKITNKGMLYCLYLFVLIITVASTEKWYYTYLYLSGVLIGVICIFTFTADIFSRPLGKLLIKLSAGSYFCFLFHQQLLMLVKRGIYKVFDISSSMEMLILYFGIPCIIIFICYAVFYFLRKHSPSVLFLLTGVR